VWNNTKGFSLIEVLVAFTILTTAIGALLVAFSSGIRNSAVTRDYNQAVIVAESRLAELGVIGPLVAGQELEGTDGRFRWATIVKDIEDEPNGNWRLLEVTVRVTWDTLNAPRTLEIDSLHWGKYAE